MCQQQGQQAGKQVSHASNLSLVYDATKESAGKKQNSLLSEKYLFISKNGKKETIQKQKRSVGHSVIE
jgi:hypothetical protein